MSMVNKGDENIISSLFMKGTNKPSKETEWKFLNYLWNNMRTQENTNQVNIKSMPTPPPPPPGPTHAKGVTYIHILCCKAYITVLEI
jgi:hypothetical protein